MCEGGPAAESEPLRNHHPHRRRPLPGPNGEDLWWSGKHRHHGGNAYGLSGKGEHRSAGPVDLLVAAVAELSGLVLLHCDRDFEALARHTGQRTVMLTDRSRS
ncbi:PIN domain nuclease [Streptomyces sp. SID5475]|nr:PIN domain nuclease [Streptomyces sp. SID5475]